jgi:hypothetical protein
MTEPRWDDDRLRAAFADRFGRPVPDGLADLAIARARATPIRRRSVVPAWAGAVAAVLVVTLGGGVLLWARASAPEPSPSPPQTALPAPPGVDEFPAEVLGLAVVSVSEAIAQRDAGLDDTEIAVRGWMSGMPPIECPAPAEVPTPVELVCPESLGSWLTEQAEATWTVEEGGLSGGPPSGPALQPIFDAAAPRATIEGAGRTGLDPTPLPVVLVGHFDDHRSLLCSDVDACRRNFIVDARVWVAGTPSGREVVRLEAPTEEPELQEDEAAALASAAGRPKTDPWIGLIDSSLVAEIDPRIAQTWGLADAPLIWVVRQLERDGARSVAHTYFVDDATGNVFRSTRARIVLAVGAGEQVVDLGEGVRVTLTDRTGTVDEAHPLAAEGRAGGVRVVPGGENPPVRLWQPAGRPRELAIEWVGSPCDEDWSLVVRNPSPSIELDHPPIEGCPAIPVPRRVLLTFSFPVSLADVLVSQISPYRPD